MQTLEEILTNTAGWLFEEEARLLHRYAGQVIAPSVIVEIGSYRGRSTLVLAHGSTVPIYAIDPHIVSPGDDFQFGDADRAAWTANVHGSGMADRIKPINLPSADAARAWSLPIGLLWIDGAHSCEAVCADLAGYVRFVVKGGCVALHDSTAPQIIEAFQPWIDMGVLEFESFSVLTTVLRKR